MMGIKEDLPLWFINFLINFLNFLTGRAVNIPLELNEQLAEESHKPIIRNF